MFNFFNKKKIIQDEDINFLKEVVSRLPSKYLFLSKQITKDFILGKEINKFGDEGTFTLTLNANLEKKFSNKKMPKFFIIKDIRIWNKLTEAWVNVELHILEGMLAGFRFTSKYASLDYNNMDLSGIKEKLFKDEEKEELKSVLGKAYKIAAKHLDIESTFRIELPEGDFYVIKDLGDGNYLSVTKTGQVYGMIHDPYEIELLFDKITDLVDAIENNKFNIQEYYQHKFK